MKIIDLAIAGGCVVVAALGAFIVYRAHVSNATGRRPSTLAWHAPDRRDLARDDQGHLLPHGYWCSAPHGYVYRRWHRADGSVATDWLTRGGQRVGCHQPGAGTH